MYRFSHKYSNNAIKYTHSAYISLTYTKDWYNPSCISLTHIPRTYGFWLHIPYAARTHMQHGICTHIPSTYTLILWTYSPACRFTDSVSIHILSTGLQLKAQRLLEHHNILLYPIHGAERTCISQTVIEPS